MWRNTAGETVDQGCQSLQNFFKRTLAQPESSLGITYAGFQKEAAKKYQPRREGGSEIPDPTRTKLQD